ncbi:MAG: hypothetical protein OXF88_06155 [Rhodobacteraceae bacterium]|nr:hypothetical protein [Paracoccaceae bacterium]MCY4139231.1 hypothetical protein [Paracoccaceae bacterium]
MSETNQDGKPVTYYGGIVDDFYLLEVELNPKVFRLQLDHHISGARGEIAQNYQTLFEISNQKALEMALDIVRRLEPSILETHSDVLERLQRIEDMVGKIYTSTL